MKADEVSVHFASTFKMEHRRYRRSQHLYHFGKAGESSVYICFTDRDQF